MYQDSRNSLAGQFWLETFYEVVVKMLAKTLLSSSILMGTEGLLPKWLTDVAGKLVLVVSKISQLLFMSISLQGCLTIPHTIAAIFIKSK